MCGYFIESLFLSIASSLLCIESLFLPIASFLLCIKSLFLPITSCELTALNMICKFFKKELMNISISKLNIDDAANLSRSLIASNTTLLQQRLMISAVAAFFPKDNCLVAKLDAQVKNIARALIEIKNSERAELSELHVKLAKNKRINDNITFFKVGDMEHVRWTHAALLECSRLFFSRNEEYLDFAFELDEFMKFWLPKLHSKKRVPNQAAKGIVQSLDAIAKTTYQIRYNDNGKLRLESVPIFSSVSVTDYRYVEVSLNPKFMPFLVFFRKEIIKIGYTRFPLYLIKDATSEYTMRLWMILLRRANPFLKSNEIKITVEDLRDELGATDSYKNFSDLKKNVLDKAIRDIISITSNIDKKCKKDNVKRERLKITAFEDGKFYKTETRGRKTTAIVFKIDVSEMEFDGNVAEKNVSKEKVANGLASEDSPINMLQSFASGYKPTQQPSTDDFTNALF